MNDRSKFAIHIDRLETSSVQVTRRCFGLERWSHVYLVDDSRNLVCHTNMHAHPEITTLTKLLIILKTVQLTN